MHCTYTINTD